MINIPTIISALSAIASTVDRILDTKRARQEADRHHQSEGLAKRLNDLEESDLEQTRLTSELSRNVEELAKAIEVEIEKNKTRDARTLRLLYVALGVGFAALVISIVALLR